MKGNEKERRKTKRNEKFFYLRKRYTNDFSLLYLSAFLDVLLDKFSIFLRRRPFRTILYDFFMKKWPFWPFRTILYDFFMKKWPFRPFRTILYDFFMKKWPFRPFCTISYDFFMKKLPFRTISYDFHEKNAEIVRFGHFVRYRTGGMI